MPSGRTIASRPPGLRNFSHCSMKSTSGASLDDDSDDENVPSASFFQFCPNLYLREIARSTFTLAPNGGFPITAATSGGVLYSSAGAFRRAMFRRLSKCRLHRHRTPICNATTCSTVRPSIYAIRARTPIASALLMWPRTPADRGASGSPCSEPCGCASGKSRALPPARPPAPLRPRAAQDG